MGGNNFSEEGEGATVEEAFKKAREHALWYHGHGGYTGSLAEKSEFTVIPDSEWEGKYDPKWYANKLIDDCDPRIDDKWGPAGAIKLEEGRWLFFGWASS